MKTSTNLTHFVCSDPVMKQLLLHLDETLALGSKFVLANLDDCHLFVAQDVYEQLKVNSAEELMLIPNYDKVMMNMNWLWSLLVKK